LTTFVIIKEKDKETCWHLQLASHEGNDFFIYMAYKDRKDIVQARVRGANCLTHSLFRKGKVYPAFQYFKKACSEQPKVKYLSVLSNLR
jgi:hypothetical protein